MHPNISPSLFLVIVFIDLSVSFSLNDDKHSDCARNFNCGNITGIGYPFWGDTQSNYCGHPDFELKCHVNVTEIEINSQNYQVLKIDQSSRTLSIARTDYWNGNCPSTYINTTLDLSPFSYTNPTEILSLFYGCLPNETISSYRFNCSGDPHRENYFWQEPLVTSFSRNLISCKVNIIVPASELAIVEFILHNKTLDSVVADGFNVKYYFEALTNCFECEKSGGRCGSEPAFANFMCYCKDGVHANSCPEHPRKEDGPSMELSMRKGVPVLACGAILGMITLTCYLKRKELSAKSKYFWNRTKDAQRVEDFLNNYGALAPKRYSCSDIKKITNSFKHKLGQGGCGRVFKGKLLDGRQVAVKVLIQPNGGGEEFINEVASITRTCHINVVDLLGFCYNGSKCALVYEYMPNGSLDRFIYKDKAFQLGWEILFQIAVGIARGLEYLHRGCNLQILHLDIKPHNILLDQDLCPKISDFGMAKLCTRKKSVISILGARGTFGYIAPEVLSRNFGPVSHKSDVYSYGMMVLELVGGRKNNDVNADHISEIYFPCWIYKRLQVEQDLGLLGVTSEEEGNIARKMLLVGLWCIQVTPSERPSISRVVEMLEGSLNSLTVPPKPFISSPLESTPYLSCDDE